MFRTNWTVPAEPTSDSGQLIYYFNGIQNSDRNSILQPVLQWGISPAGGGAYWSVASWYISPTGHAVFSSLIRVNVGDILIGAMTQTATGGGLSTTHRSLSELKGPRCRLKMPTSSSGAMKTMEAYNVSQCSDYPDAAVAFGGIFIDTKFQAIRALLRNQRKPGYRLRAAHDGGKQLPNRRRSRRLYSPVAELNSCARKSFFKYCPV